MNSIIRSPVAGELPFLREIWDSSFSQDDKELFFKSYFKPDMCKIAICDGKPVCAGYLIHVGDYVSGISGAQEYPCAHIYAVATIPMYREKGFGSAVVNELIKAGYSMGFPAIVLRPAADKLFEYYNKRSSFQEWFYVNERHFSKLSPTTSKTSEIKQISDEEYADLRSNLLSGMPHIRLNSHALAYKNNLCKLYGGGFFSLKTPDGYACAIVEVQRDGVVHVKELLSPSQQEQAIISALAKEFRSKEYIVRTPASQAEAEIATETATDKTRFAMLAATVIAGPDPQSPSELGRSDGIRPYAGPAFD